MSAFPLNETDHVPKLTCPAFGALPGRLALGLTAWLRPAAIGLSRDLTVVLDGHVVRGCFEGLDGDGALLLRLADGTLRPLHAGEVTFASPGRTLA